MTPEYRLSKFDRSVVEFKANFKIFSCLYHMLFDLETIGVS